VIPALAHIGHEPSRAKGVRRSLARRTADTIGRAMTDVLENEEIAGRAGLLQRLDPRVKLLTIVLFSVTTTLVRSLPLLVALAATTLALAAASRVPVASFARKVWASAGLFAVLIAAPAATRLITPGAVVVPLGPLSLTAPGIAGAATLVARVIAGAGFALLVVWTTRWTDLLHALSALRVPEVMVTTLAMAQKQILTLLRTVEQIHLARESRALAVGSTAEERTWVVGRMAFVTRKSLKTADDVYDAMLARGFDGTVRSVRRLTAGRADALWAAACVTACTILLAADRLAVPR
jgi:cobalt/nickel transport system permease protein